MSGPADHPTAECVEGVGPGPCDMSMTGNVCDACGLVDPNVCPQCGSHAVLGHMFVLTDRYCLDCDHEWSTIQRRPK